MTADVRANIQCFQWLLVVLYCIVVCVWLHSLCLLVVELTNGFHAIDCSLTYWWWNEEKEWGEHVAFLDTHQTCGNTWHFLVCISGGRGVWSVSDWNDSCLSLPDQLVMNIVKILLNTARNFCKKNCLAVVGYFRDRKCVHCKTSCCKIHLVLQVIFPLQVI